MKKKKECFGLKLEEQAWNCKEKKIVQSIFCPRNEALNMLNKWTEKHQVTDAFQQIIQDYKH